MTNRLLTNYKTPGERKFPRGIQDIEKTAGEFGKRWADGYIKNYNVAHVLTEAEEWVKSLVDDGTITMGFVGERYPSTLVTLEFGIQFDGFDTIYFFGTEWYRGEKGNGTSHSFTIRDVFQKK